MGERDTSEIWFNFVNGSWKLISELQFVTFIRLFGHCQVNFKKRFYNQILNLKFFDMSDLKKVYIQKARFWFTALRENDIICILLRFFEKPIDFKKLHCVRFWIEKKYNALVFYLTISWKVRFWIKVCIRKITLLFIVLREKTTYFAFSVLLQKA